jgi:chlorite dismutase
MSPSPSARQESHSRGGDEPRRQIVNFTFYKVGVEWRRLPRAERDEHRREAAAVLRRWNIPGELSLLTYSTVGTRSDCDLMLWRICYSFECMQQMTTDFLRTSLGGYLEPAHSYLAMTKRSQYMIGHDRDSNYDLRGVIKPGAYKYLFLFPMSKTREWYGLPFEERQRIVRDYIRVIDDFPRVRFNITYSFGLDDQDFMVACGSDHAEDVLDLMQQLRETEASAFNLQDTPVFTCLHTSIEEMLERLG